MLERSEVTPVVVDFWAPWCGPCRALGPLLERLAEEHGGEFVLAKVNSTRRRRLAAFGIQSIPAVKGFRDGTLVAEFVGAQPEPEVRQLLAESCRRTPTGWSREAAALTPAAAEAALGEGLALEPRHPRALFALARRLADRGDAGRCSSSSASRLARRWRRRGAADRELRTRADGAGDEAALRAPVAADPADLDARLGLGRALAALGRYEDALAELLEVIRRDRHFADEGARKAMVDVFAVLGSSPLTDRYRGELAKALFC